MRLVNFKVDAEQGYEVIANRCIIETVRDVEKIALKQIGLVAERVFLGNIVLLQENRP